MNTADGQRVICKPRPRGGVHHLPTIQEVVGAVNVVPLMPLVPDGSLIDIRQHGLTHNPAGPVQDWVAGAVWCEELSPGVGVERVHVTHHTPGVVEAAEAVWLEGGGDARALDINSRTQILQRHLRLTSNQQLSLHRLTFGQNKLRDISNSVGP